MNNEFPNLQFQKKMMRVAGIRYHAGQLENAARWAALGLDVDVTPLTPEMVREILHDAEKLTVFLELARLYVDPKKTLANATLNPRASLAYLEEATKVLALAHANKEVGYVLQKQKENPQLLSLYPELARDRAKVAEAIAPLDPRRARQLRLLAAKILRSALSEIPQDFPVSPLIQIEIELLHGAMGDSPNFLRIIDPCLDKIQEQIDTNPHRVATVASWVASWANKYGVDFVESKANRIFNKVIEKHPQWKYMKIKEWAKRILKNKRDWMFSVFPWTQEERGRIDALVGFMTTSHKK